MPAEETSVSVKKQSKRRRMEQLVNKTNVPFQSANINASDEFLIDFQSGKARKRAQASLIV